MSRRQRLTLVATILGSTVVFLDATVINVALPAIAVLGAVISAQFDASAGAAVSGGPLTAAAPEASTAAFHLGVLIAGLLMIAGGIASGVGIQNPRRKGRLISEKRASRQPA